MDIQRLGNTCFRICSQRGIVLTDPPATGPAADAALEADIVTSSVRPSAAAARPPIGAKPFRISGPGEYEVNGIFVVGVRVPGRPPELEETELVTGYCITMETLTVCHLGPIHRPPTKEQIEALGAVDVLLLPVGGGGALGPGEAVEVVNMIEPSLIVPMRYRSDGESDLEPVGRFCEEMGVLAAEPVQVLSLSRARLPIERQLVMMETAAGWRP